MTITTIILCGGEGTRIRPIIGEIPKCLAKINNKPFLEYILDHLITQGIRRVVLCLGYKADMVMDHFNFNPFNIHEKQALGRYKSILLSCSIEKEPLGTGGALKNALPLINTEKALVLNGDTYCAFDLKEILEEYPNKPFVNVVDKTNTDAGVKLIPRNKIEFLPDKMGLSLEEIFMLNNWYEDTYFVYKNFIDIGTEEGLKGVEEFLRQEGVISG